jgi:hypothetical protein
MFNKLGKEGFFIKLHSFGVLMHLKENTDKRTRDVYDIYIYICVCVCVCVYSLQSECVLFKYRNVAIQVT